MLRLPLTYRLAKIAGEVLLSTPYYSQRDNIPSGNDMPYRTCFSSSCAMLAVTLKPGCITGDDDYIKKRQPRGDSTDSSAQIKTLKSLRYQCPLCYELQQRHNQEAN
jgi:hypothetical protein